MSETPKPVMRSGSKYNADDPRRKVLGRLFNAMLNQDAKLVEKMLDKDPTLLNDTFHTDNSMPIHWAVWAMWKPGSRLDILKLLVARGADVNTRDTAGGTPLHDAAATGNVKAAKFLIHKGANRRLKDNKGRTFLDVAVDRHTIKLFKDAGLAKEPVGSDKQQTGKGGGRHQPRTPPPDVEVVLDDPGHDDDYFGLE